MDLDEARELWLAATDKQAAMLELLDTEIRAATYDLTQMLKKARRLALARHALLLSAALLAAGVLVGSADQITISGVWDGQGQGSATEATAAAPPSVGDQDHQTGREAPWRQPHSLDPCDIAFNPLPVFCPIKLSLSSSVSSAACRRAGLAAVWAPPRPW
ncbi:MAG TPA: hypothetical protein VK923_14330 [Euzebyales bacterium]|nr:hypothetical protein [Euzebyales bacterium]